MNAATVVEIGPENLARFSFKAARVHMAAYSSGHFTSSFGLSKLAEYNALLMEHSDVALAAVEGERVLGFLVSGENVSRGVNEFVRRNRVFLVRKLLARPWFLFEKVFWAARAKLTKSAPSCARYRLLSIATAPEAQSAGVGALLLAELEERLRGKGITRYGLSVLTKNARAAAFYRRHGFLLEKQELGSAYFYKDLAPRSATKQPENGAQNELDVESK